MCCCCRPEAATLGRREAAGAGPRDRAPPSPARPGRPGAHPAVCPPAARCPPPGGGSCVRASPAPYARFPRGRVAAAPGAPGSRDPPARRRDLPTLTAPGGCQCVFRLGSPTPKAPTLRGSPTSERHPRPRRAPHVPPRMLQDPAERADPRSPSRGEGQRPGRGRRRTSEVTPSCSAAAAPSLTPPAPGGQPSRDPCAELATPTLRRGRVWDVQPGRRGPGARGGEAGGSGPVNTSCGIRDQNVPRRRPPARGAAVAAAAEQLNGAGTGAAPPLPPPPGAERSAGRGPAAEGARRHLHRPASARRARPPGRPPPEPGGAGARGERVRGRARAARSARGPRRRRDAAGTLLRPLPGSHSSPWAGRQAWCQEPGLPTPPPPAGALGRGGRGLASQRGAPRLSRSREEGCRRPPPPRACSRPLPGRTPPLLGLAQRPHGGVPGAAGSCPRASGARGRCGPKWSAGGASRPGTGSHFVGAGLV
ncbi:translation initiation factor IF-2-like [Zalophus californianus]|uniref:Translation initiation factor IF-2-like n=1 Tax=Zalophus californianus TaxID=9704 RepID=A0A6P9FEU5_ZALCA|nr:translation initiation factor IF-2-like [Zalophus californianus]